MKNKMTLDELREDIAFNLPRYLTPTELKKLRDHEKLHDDEYDEYEAKLINKVFIRFSWGCISNKTKTEQETKQSYSIALSGEQWEALKGLIDSDQDNNHRYALSSFCSDADLETFDNALESFRSQFDALKIEKKFPTYSKY
jgi:hypothetical protein